MKSSPYWVLPIHPKGTSKFWRIAHRLLETPSGSDTRHFCLKLLQLNWQHHPYPSHNNIPINHEEAKQCNPIMCLEGRMLDIFWDKYWWLPLISLQWNKSNENQDWNSDYIIVCIKIEDHLNSGKKEWEMNSRTCTLTVQNIY